MQMRLDELFLSHQVSSKSDEIEGVEIGLHFARIRPRLCIQIRLDEFFSWDQVSPKKDEIEGVS